MVIYYEMSINCLLSSEKVHLVSSRFMFAGTQGMSTNKEQVTSLLDVFGTSQSVRLS